MRFSPARFVSFCLFSPAWRLDSATDKKRQNAHAKTDKTPHAAGQAAPHRRRQRGKIQQEFARQEASDLPPALRIPLTLARSLLVQWPDNGSITTIRGGEMRNVIYGGNVDALNGHRPYRDGECVAFVQELTSVGHTSGWRPGPRVVDLSYLNPGTVIANFVSDSNGVGRFPNQHGYHAALFLQFGSRSMTTGRAMRIVVMDQFKRRRPFNVVKQRPIDAYGDRSHAAGNPISDSDNADQFYVVVVA